MHEKFSLSRAGKNQFAVPHLLLHNHQFNQKQRKEHFKQKQSLSNLHSTKDMNCQRKKLKNDALQNTSTNIFHTNSHNKWNSRTLLRKLNAAIEFQWFWMFYMVPPKRITEQHKDPQIKDNHTTMHLGLAISIFVVESIDLM